MRPYFTPRFLRAYAEAPANIRKAFDQKLTFLLQNLRHPSLRAKKYDEAKNLWQARVTQDWRFYFTIEGDSYRLLEIKSHPK